MLLQVPRTATFRTLHSSSHLQDLTQHNTNYRIKSSISYFVPLCVKLTELGLCNFSLTTDSHTLASYITGYCYTSRHHASDAVLREGANNVQAAANRQRKRLPR